MREIEFRGMDKDGDWYHGDLLHHDNNVLIIVDGFGRQHKIVNETLGQFTGYYDCKCIKIYEGDILQDTQLEDWLFKVEWQYDCFVAIGNPDVVGKLYGWSLDSLLNRASHKIVGNIHNNKKLLEVNNE